MGKKLTGNISALAFGFAGLAVLTAAGAAVAGTITIGNGAGGSNATGLVGAGDPNLIGNGADISIYMNGKGSVSNDVLIALLVPNESTDLFGSTNPLGTINIYGNYASSSSIITGVGSSNFIGNTGTFATKIKLGKGTAAYSGNGFWGDFIGSTGSSKLSSFLGTNFNSSNNGSSFTGFDLGLSPSISATEFGVYTFDITTGSLTGNGLVDIKISGGLPVGSILAAYSDKGDSTIWTNEGGINTAYPNPFPAGGPLPISATLPLTAAGGLGLLAFALRKRKAIV